MTLGPPDTTLYNMARTRQGLGFSFGFGFAVWLVATVVFRIWGHSIFLVENPWVLVAWFVGAGVGLYFVAGRVFSWFGMARAERRSAAILMVLPGMILDSAVVSSFSIALPNMPEASGVYFGGWLLFAYAAVLVRGLIPSQRQRT